MKEKFHHFNELVRSLSHNSSISFKLFLYQKLKFYEKWGKKGLEKFIKSLFEKVSAFYFTVSNNSHQNKAFLKYYFRWWQMWKVFHRQIYVFSWIQSSKIFKAVLRIHLEMMSQVLKLLMFSFLWDQSLIVSSWSLWSQVELNFNVTGNMDTSHPTLKRIVDFAAW